MTNDELSQTRRQSECLSPWVSRSVCLRQTAWQSVLAYSEKAVKHSNKSQLLRSLPDCQQAEKITRAVLPISLNNANPRQLGNQAHCRCHTHIPVPDRPTRLRGRLAAKTHYDGLRAQELSESRGGRPGLLVPDSPHGL